MSSLDIFLEHKLDVTRILSSIFKNFLLYRFPFLIYDFAYADIRAIKIGQRSQEKELYEIRITICLMSKLIIIR
ncbi:hypothetical protein T11_6649 [Trichinella zimbabwensis]|uniref:Uncharacterized protein n=1 Tax=Trichinella zimbabwensis TaxID=268475 RepID=A0A0V1HM67_9BILA|nr:hypothetical protein T11_6649 [Trichinella zimbabwensis]